MRGVAELLDREAGLEPRIVAQAEAPDDLAAYACIVVYIHGRLETRAEEAFIRYTEAKCRGATRLRLRIRTPRAA